MLLARRAHGLHRLLHLRRLPFDKVLDGCLAGFGRGVDLAFVLVTDGQLGGEVVGGRAVGGNEG